MKQRIWRIAVFSIIALAVSVGGLASSAKAEENSESETITPSGTSISLMPVSKILQIASNSVYEDKMTVNNDGDTPIKIEVYASPYSYVYSEAADSYELGFNTDNNFTQIARWITFENNSGEWVKKSTYDIAPKSAVEVKYRISTPESIPGGGQYAVIFAHTLTSSTNSNGIRTEVSPGMVVYGRSSEGETLVKPVISDLKVDYNAATNGQKGSATTAEKHSTIYASAKVKNEGNVDFNAIGVMKVQNLFGGVVYETPQTSGRISIIPDAELVVSDEWANPPFFGIYRVTWTVTVGDSEETIEKLVFINTIWLLIITIILLTFIVVGCIIGVRRRKERRSRLAV